MLPGRPVAHAAERAPVDLVFALLRVDRILGFDDFLAGNWVDGRLIVDAVGLTNAVGTAVVERTEHTQALLLAEAPAVAAHGANRIVGWGVADTRMHRRVDTASGLE